MRTLASELSLHVEKLTSQPRIYADANVPAGVILYMRRRLKWDVLAVVEDDTRRALAFDPSPHLVLMQQYRNPASYFYDREMLGGII